MLRVHFLPEEPRRLFHLIDGELCLNSSLTRSYDRGVWRQVRIENLCQRGQSIAQAQQRTSNVHVKEGVTEDEFVAMREARDAKLSAPRLLLPSIQVNIRAGNFPPAEANGVRYLTIPVKFRNIKAA
jgi:hypothetical protein